MPARKAAPQTLALAPVLDLNEASALHAKLMELRGSAVEVDASSVERVGALCVQVLMAGAKAWEQEKLSFTFSKMSDAFAKTTQLIGVDVDRLMSKEI
jgi:chemotaxis protein CheX